MQRERFAAGVRGGDGDALWLDILRHKGEKKAYHIANIRKRGVGGDDTETNFVCAQIHLGDFYLWLWYLSTNTFC